VTTAVSRYVPDTDQVPIGDGDTYPGPMVDLRVIKEALGRHRLFWVSCAVLGLLLGSAFHLVVPASYVAITRLYLTEPTNSATYTVADDVSLLETNTVAYRALKALHVRGNVSPPGYQGLALGDALLEIKASGSTPAAAVRWAKALAEAFLSVRGQTLGGQTRLVVASLQAQVAQLQAELQRINTAITALSAAPAGPGSANEVADLVDARGTDVSQLTALQNEVQQDLLEERAVDEGSYVLDPARAVLVHTKRLMAEDGLSGLVAGLAIGLGAVTVGAVISDRPRRRGEVAALLGVPVELSLDDAPEPGILSLTTMRGSLKRPGSGLERARQRLVAKLTVFDRPAIALVATGERCVRTSAVLLASAALSMAGDGKRVALVDMARGRPLARLFRARVHPKDRAALQPVSFGRWRLSLAVAPDDPMALDPTTVTKDADTVLLLADADPALGAEHLRSWAPGSVVVLRSGKATDVLIQATGDMLRQAGVPPVSAVLLGAERGDETSGAASAASATWAGRAVP